MISRKHPPRSEQGRLLLTLHPENGWQSSTRTNTERLMACLRASALLVCDDPGLSEKCIVYSGKFCRAVLVGPNFAHRTPHFAFEPSRPGVAPGRLSFG